ncbi:hypothetical protein CISG_02194 [Coccidioides immitis RMSCC 3703]|uniref:Uncharacterized protein n=1 Tax=Coccidioides immitis RMSCC 3703 TaxID=454286 RepID=A0A0J8R985_COCIT|nr:hypothetical protein CISG_02194 [Coccidioides immitis RMSCC 3703]
MGLHLGGRVLSERILEPTVQQLSSSHSSSTVSTLVSITPRGYLGSAPSVACKGKHVSNLTLVPTDERVDWRGCSPGHAVLRNQHYSTPAPTLAASERGIVARTARRVMKQTHVRREGALRKH